MAHHSSNASRQSACNSSGWSHLWTRPVVWTQWQQSWVRDGAVSQVRRLVEHAGAVVRNLKRTRIGSYRLDHQLGIGKFRQLKPLQAEAVLKAPVQELGYV